MIIAPVHDCACGDEGPGLETGHGMKGLDLGYDGWTRTSHGEFGPHPTTGQSSCWARKACGGPSAVKSPAQSSGDGDVNGTPRIRYSADTGAALGNGGPHPCYAEGSV